METEDKAMMDNGDCWICFFVALGVVALLVRLGWEFIHKL
jgi:hypothetical protein